MRIFTKNFLKNLISSLAFPEKKIATTALSFHETNTYFFLLQSSIQNRIQENHISLYVAINCVAINIATLKLLKLRIFYDFVKVSILILILKSFSQLAFIKLFG